jgi:hypothetical protein
MGQKTSKSLESSIIGMSSENHRNLDSESEIIGLKSLQSVGDIDYSHV